MLRLLGRGDTSWLFNLGADFYAWFTGQRVWRESCRLLAAQLPHGSLRVLDLGCGYGVSAITVARARPEAMLVGVDRAARMLRIASRSSNRLSEARRLHWAQADAASLPFTSDTFDAVTAHSVLYLLPDRAAALREVKRVLKPDGLLVAMEPAAEAAPLPRIIQLSMDPRFWLSAMLWRCMSRIHGRFDRVALAELLDTAGFMDVRVERTIGGLGLLAVGRRG